MTRRLLPLLLAWLLLAAPALAQDDDGAAKFEVLDSGWTQILEDAEKYSEQAGDKPELAAEILERIQTVRTQARTAKQEAEDGIKAVEPLLEALGPAPAEGEPAEADEVAAKRADYNEQLAALKARVSRAELATTQAKALEEKISARQLSRRFESLWARYPLPIAPDTGTAAISAGANFLARLVAAPAAWWQGLPADRSGLGQGLRVILAIVIGAGLGFALRLVLLARWGRDPGTAEPSYARRLFGAIAEGVARGIVPALVLIGFLLWAGPGEGLRPGLFADAVTGLSVALILFVLATGLPRAVLAPDLPAWRLAPVTAAGAQAISRRVTILAGLFGIDLFCRIAGAETVTQPEARSFFGLIANGLEAAAVIALVRPALWRTDPDDPDARTGRFWPGLRSVAGLIAIAALLTALIGYAALADYLVKNLLVSGVIGGAAVLVRGLLRELIGAALRSGITRDKLGVGGPTRTLLKFWIRAVLDVAMVAATLFLVAPVWGVPIADLWRWTSDTLRGFTIGNVTISITDIVVAVVVFTLAMMATRMVQRTLSDRVLPQTRLDVGVRHSLAAGFGYVGMTIAAALGIAALGIDLSNIALIAGALSVGIGFGLQNVVNNFVSGLILLIERPIKVGDWVVVGGSEGLVKRINVRATELETFQRASVIIPNADILSGSLVNWTHKDRHGRIEIVVGVAYGSDTALVRELLLNCARDHPKVLDQPEPFVLFQDFGASSLDFELRAFTSDVMYKIRIASDLRYDIDKAFRDANIEIPFPQRVVHLTPAEAVPEAARVQGRFEEPDQAPGGTDEG